VVLGFRLCLDNPTLPKITAVAADPSAASYTTPWDTTGKGSPEASCLKKGTFGVLPQTWCCLAFRRIWTMHLTIDWP